MEHWLFEERLPYREIARRAREELGVNCSFQSIGRLYQHALKFQAQKEVADAQKAAQEVIRAGANMDDLRKSSMQVIATRLLEKAMDHAEVKELAALGRIVLEGQEKEIQLGRLALARDRFEFKTSKAVLHALPLANKFKEEDQQREKERIEAIKREIFGDELNYIIR